MPVICWIRFQLVPAAGFVEAKCLSSTRAMHLFQGSEAIVEVLT
jgi:hypothetical protein